MPPSQLSDADDVLVVGRWVMRHLTLTPYKIKALWEMMQRHRTLFSDITRGDPANFLHSLMSPDSMWFEVREVGVVVGLIWFDELHNIVDCGAHIVFFDRRPTEKLPLCREALRWIFMNTAVHRITVAPPAIYHKTIKLLVSLGFTLEGRKREALLMGGNWVDQVIYGITRSEVV